MALPLGPGSSVTTLKDLLCVAKQFTLCHGGQLRGKAALLLAGADTPTDFQFGSKPIEKQKTFILVPSLLQSQSSDMYA